MKHLFLVICTTLIAIILEIISLSHYVEPFRPHFILIVVIFWSLHTHREYSIGSAWLTGIFTDICMNHLIGIHGFIFALICFLIKKNRKWLNKLTIMEQAIVFSGLYCLQIVIIFFANNMLGINNPYGYWWLFSILTSVMLWPLIYALLSEACYFFRV